MGSLSVLLLLIFACTANGYSVGDCPASLTRDRYLQVDGDSCFQFVFSQKLNYFDAQKDCESRGGTLAVIKSQDTQTFLYSQLHTIYLGDHSDNEEVWIGLDDQIRENHFTWQDGTDLVYSNWGSGEGPDNWSSYRSEDCVSMSTSTGKWKDHECGSATSTAVKYPYMCQHIIQNFASVQTTPAELRYTVNNCPASVPRDKYLQVYDNSCFQFVFNEEKNYFDAESDCESRGGTLALIKSQDIQKFLYTHLSRTYMYDHSLSDEVWIGLHDQAQEFDFTWQDGTQVSYSNWASSEGPTNWSTFNAEDCISMSTSSGEWRDHECVSHTEGFLIFSTTTAVKYPYICQFQVLRLTAPIGTTTMTSVPTTIPTIPGTIANIIMTRQESTTTTITSTSTTSRTTTTTATPVLTTSPTTSVTMTTIQDPSTTTAFTTTQTATRAPTTSLSTTHATRSTAEPTRTATEATTTPNKMLVTPCPPFQCSLDCGMLGFFKDPVTGCIECRCDV